MSDTLPEGFTLDEAAPALATAAAKGGSATESRGAVSTSGAGSTLPEGFALDSDSPRTAREPQSVIPHVIDKFKQGTANLLGLAGAPVSAINQAIAVATTGKPAKNTPVGGIEQVQKGWEGILGVKHVPRPKDLYGEENKNNEYLGTISEFLGGALIPGAGSVATASRRLLTGLVEVGTAAMSGASSVEMKEVGGHLAPTYGLTKEQGEEIGAGMGSLMGPKLVQFAGQKLAQGIAKGQQLASRADITGFSPESQKVAANSLLMKDISKALEHAPMSEANLARSIQLSERIPGFAPTIAQRTDAPGLVAMQKEVAKKSPESLAKAAAADERNLASIAAFREKSFPTVTGKPQADGTIAPVAGLTDPARVKLSTNRSLNAMEAEKNVRELRSLTDQYRRTTNNEAIGDALRKQYWQSRDTAKIVNDVKLSDVYGTARKFNIKDDVSDIRESIQKIVKADAQTFQDMPPLFSKVLSEYPAGTPASFSRVAVTPTGAQRPVFRNEMKAATPGKSEVSFEELHSLYKQANKDWADATAAGNSSKAHYMGMIRDQIGAKVNRYNSPEYGELASKFSDFNQSYTKYSQTFREGAGGEIAKRTRDGIVRDSEDIVAKTFLQTGDKKKGVQDFFAIYGSDAKAAALLRDGITDNFSKAAIRNGSFDPKAAAGWLKKNETAMAELPELRAKLSNAQQMSSELVNRQLMLQKQRQVLDRTELAKVARSSNPEEVVRKAIAEPKVMKALLVGAITPESKASIARGIADVVGTHPDSFQFLAANEKSLKPALDLLGKGHWDNLKTIAEAEKVAGRVKAPTAVELSKLQDVGEQYLGTSVKSLFSKLMAAKQGRISEGYAIADVSGRAFYKIRSEELSRLREAAIFNPDTAELLAKLVKRNAAPTRSELLNLQRLSFDAGANSVMQTVGESEGLREKERQRQQQQPAKREGGRVQ